MRDFLLALYRASSGRSKGLVEDFQSWQQRYEQIYRRAERDEPPFERDTIGKPKK